MDDIRYELRRMAIALVGIPDPTHPAAQFRRDPEREQELQVPMPSTPLLSNVELDDVAIHFRCGDIIEVRPHAGYGYGRFSIIAKYISRDARSIGIVTQPFQGQNRRTDGTVHLRCPILIGALQQYLQERFPNATVHVRNSPNETVALSYARFIMANQTLAAGYSSFVFFPFMASFGTGYLQKPKYVEQAFEQHVNARFIEFPDMMSSVQLFEMWSKTSGQEQILDWFTNDEEAESPAFSLDSDSLLEPLNVSFVCDSTRQYCVAPLQGDWVWTPNKAFNNPTCCPWDKSDINRELIPEICGTDFWPQNAGDFDRNAAQHYSGNPSFLAQAGGHGCICRDRRNFTEEYTWTSPKLTRPFDASYTCQLLKDRRVLIIGDSASQQVATTLMNSLFHASCVGQFRFVQSDFLLSHKRDRGYNITNILDRYQDSVDIVLWGVGPHVYGNFQETLQTAVSLMLERYPHLKFIYRTQQPGGCSDQPLLNMPPDEAALEMQRLNMTRKYNYQEFHDRDMFAMHYLREVAMPVLDLRMLYNRPDAHVSPQDSQDCLHMCIPGPLDVVPNLFQQLLINDEI